jgi:hypothetical protein
MSFAGSPFTLERTELSLAIEIPASFLDAGGASLSDSLWDADKRDESIAQQQQSSSLHTRWLVPDLDGDRWHDNNGDSAG